MVDCRSITCSLICVKLPAFLLPLFDCLADLVVMTHLQTYPFFQLIHLLLERVPCSIAKGFNESYTMRYDAKPTERVTDASTPFLLHSYSSSFLFVTAPHAEHFQVTEMTSSSSSNSTITRLPSQSFLPHLG